MSKYNQSRNGFPAHSVLYKPAVFLFPCRDPMEISCISASTDIKSRWFVDNMRDTLCLTGLFLCILSATAVPNPRSVLRNLLFGWDSRAV